MLEEDISWFHLRVFLDVLLIESISKAMKFLVDVEDGEIILHFLLDECDSAENGVIVVILPDCTHEGEQIGLKDMSLVQFVDIAQFLRLFPALAHLPPRVQALQLLFGNFKEIKLTANKVAHAVEVEGCGEAAKAKDEKGY